MVISIEERVARLEATVEGIHRELTQIHAQLNSLTAIMIGAWITIFVAVIGVGAAVLFK